MKRIKVSRDLVETKAPMLEIDESPQQDEEVQVSKVKKDKTALNKRKKYMKKKKRRTQSNAD